LSWIIDIKPINTKHMEGFGNLEYYNRNSVPDGTERVH